jgi:hypothetical protein
MAQKPTFCAAAALAAVVVVSCLLLPTYAACPPGQTPVHCKTRGESCTQRKVSECAQPYKCQEGFCGGRPLPPDPELTKACALPVSPFQVRTGTPADHEARHRDDPPERRERPGFWKDVKAVDMVVANAGQAVYAVEDGHLSTGGSFAISSGSSSWGWSFEVITSSRSFFYTHVADPLAQNPTTGRPWGAGESVRKGQLLGWVAAHPTGGTIHLHFATREGNPCDYLRGCMGVNGMGPDSTLSKC